MKPPSLRLEHLSIAYDDKPIVKDISLSIKTGAIACLLGDSGCGKTTLLRAIAGLEPIKQGRIEIDGRVMSQIGQTVPPEHRSIGMVFQDLALFPHLSVMDNIRFGLRGKQKETQQARLDTLLALSRLGHLTQRYPHELSGGQQQRVALVRAMAPKPDILLLDEPFSAVDPNLRLELADEIRHIIHQDGMTAILVTHDQAEAFAFADEIAVMKEGELMQFDSAYNIYHQPNHRYVANFIGQGTMVKGLCLDQHTIQTIFGKIDAKTTNFELKAGQEVDLLVRPDDLIHDATSPLRPTITGKRFKGETFIYRLAFDDNIECLCLTTSHDDYPIGAKLGIKLHMDHVTLFPI